MPDKAIKAIIDIGSNSVRLMLAEVIHASINPLSKEKNTTRLYQNMTHTGGLGKEAIARTVEAIASYKKKAEEIGADEVLCFATAAVRSAPNANDFIDLVREKTGLEVDVLSGEQEAQMAFCGVGGEGRCGIIDIGGGSTELAVGEAGLIKAYTSMKLGAVRAVELYPPGDVADPLTMEAMAQWVHRVINEMSGEVKETNDESVVWTGVGGTITTLVAMELKLVKYDSAKIQGRRLSRQAIEQWKEKLSEMPLSARRKVIGLNPERADIILGGIVILLAVMEQLQIDEIKVSDSDNLEGYLKMKRGNVH